MLDIVTASSREWVKTGRNTPPPHLHAGSKSLTIHLLPVHRFTSEVVYVQLKFQSLLLEPTKCYGKLYANQR